MVKKYLKKKKTRKPRKTGLFRRRKTNLRKPSGGRRGGY